MGRVRVRARKDVEGRVRVRAQQKIVGRVKIRAMKNVEGRVRARQELWEELGLGLGRILGKS